MTDISRASLKMLKKIRRLEYIPEDQIPLNFDLSRLQYLVKIGLVEVITLVPPGKEGYEIGLTAYTLSPQGEDSIYKYRKVEMEARIALILSVLALLVAVFDALAPFDLFT